MDDDVTEDLEPLLGRSAIGACVVFGLAVAAAAVVLASPVAGAATGLLALLMALVTLTDLRHFIIPDMLSLPAVPLGIVANIAVFHRDDWLAGLTESVIGAVLAAGCFYLLRAAWFRLRGVEGLGLGDVKLAAVAGAWLGSSLLAPACLASALAGLAAVGLMAVLPGRRIAMQDQIPFGSFIAPVILLAWCWRVLDGLPLW